MTGQETLLWSIKLHCNQKYIYSTFLPLKSVRLKVWITVKSVRFNLTRPTLGVWRSEGHESLLIRTDSRCQTCQVAIWQGQLSHLHLHPRIWHAHFLLKPCPLLETYRLKKFVEPALDCARWQALQSLLCINDICSVS